MWRGGVGALSVSGPFVCRCLTSLTMLPFPHPAHRTGYADFPALGDSYSALGGGWMYVPPSDSFPKAAAMQALRSVSSFSRAPNVLGSDVELRLGLDEARRRPAVQDRVHIVQGQHAHCCPGLDRGAADMRQ